MKEIFQQFRDGRVRFLLSDKLMPYKSELSNVQSFNILFEQNKKRMKIFALLSIITIVSTEKDLQKKIKNKKSRLLRKLKKQAPANVAVDGTIGLIKMNFSDIISLISFTILSLTFLRQRFPIIF